MNNRIVRWGIIGCGKVTEVKSGPAYRQAEGFEVVAVMRRDAAKAEDYARRHGIRTFYADADALIRDADVDAVYIATPPDSHKYYALKVAAAGKPCCIEKPMAPSYADCLEIAQAFQARDIPLFVAYYRRSLPRFEQVRQWLRERAIGEVRHVSWRLMKPTHPNDLSGNDNWRTDARIAPGGYFDDVGSHGIDLLVHLLGKVRQAGGVATNQQGLYGAHDAIAGSWLHESGVTGSGSWNFGCAAAEDRVELFGSEGKIEFAVFEEKPLVLVNGGRRQEVFIDNPPHIQQYHVANMRRHLAGEIVHPSSGESASHTSWVMERILGRV
jgi:1,5-anhydro-D-fructose reductase (1,5-anhydro-D-mannitol-forming)